MKDYKSIYSRDLIQPGHVCDDDDGDGVCVCEREITWEVSKSIGVETSWHAALGVYSPHVEHFEDLTLGNQQAEGQSGKR